MSGRRFFIVLMGCAALLLPGPGRAQEPLAGSVVIAVPRQPAVQPAARPADAAQKPAAPRNTEKKRPSPPKSTQAPHGNTKAMSKQMGTQPWFLESASRKPQGEVWERGVPGQSLARKRTMGAGGSAGEDAAGAGRGGPAGQGVDTHKAIDSALQEISTYERQPPEEIATGKGSSIRGKVSTETTSWRNPVTTPVRVDQDVPVTRRNVVGAYADVVNRDDLHVTVGPELSIENDANANHHSAQHQGEGNSLGVGMHFQWAF